MSYTSTRRHRRPGRGPRRRRTLAPRRDAIDRGATSVEEVHKSIAILPLKVLEELRVLAGPVREIEKVQGHSIAAVYDAIRRINDEVESLGRELLEKRPRKKPSPHEETTVHRKAS